MIGLRQILRNSQTLWGNRHAIPSVVKSLLNDRIEPASVSVFRRMVARGHSLTAATQLPMNGDGSPIPWYTYPFVDFLSDLETASWKVLEFGSGQSTLYWAARATSVLAYENSAEWFKTMREKSPSNVEIRLFEGEKTLEEIPQLEFLPDLVVVDGLKREICVRKSLETFGLRPIYILENSDWFPKAATAMREAGLREIRFKGFGPVNGYAWSTSLMVSAENLSRLALIRPDSCVPGGLPPGDYEEKNLIR
jgi:hypothetical protein